VARALFRKGAHFANAIIFELGLVLLVLLGWRFLTTGGRDMIRMMSAPPQASAMEGGHGHHH
jgi:hypothetical protein